MASELARRVGFAAVAIPLVLLVVWYGGLPLAALVAIAAALGAAELFDLAERGGTRPARASGSRRAAALPLLTWLAAGPARHRREPREQWAVPGGHLAASSC